MKGRQSNLERLSFLQTVLVNKSDQNKRLQKAIKGISVSEIKTKQTPKNLSTNEEKGNKWNICV
jgi:hypothetical protein